MDHSNEIEEIAELVAEEHWKSGRVDPVEIATTSGITFNFGHYDEWFDGYLECKSRRFHIYINLDTNRSADAPRARFSFAHELGHYFLDWHRGALERGVPPHASKADFLSQSVVEREADSFAANLLLPRSRIKKEAARVISADEVRRLADQFGASLSATAIRCARLDLGSLIVMRWTAAGRAWCWSSSDFEDKTRNRAFRQVDRIPDDSTTGMTLAGSGQNTEAIGVRGTTLSTWFPSIRAGSSDDDILLEECISLGPHGALTLLRPSD
jgi:Zn-dependent peptidase ImmA (M78 family)